MILFKHEHIFPILIGLKIQTRRTWTKPRVKVGSIQKAKTEMISRYYFAKLRILEVYQQPLGAMTEQDAYEEGGYTLEGYKAEFDKIYGHWDDAEVVWVVKFEVVECQS